jgi:death on curing protein
MILEVDILFLHASGIRDFGGSSEIRDRNLLLSAINRPFQTFDGKELYPGPLEKAAALGESLIINHPFVDGNKRTALLAMLALLNEYEQLLAVQEDEMYNFIIAMSTGEKRFEEILTWLKSKSL